MSLITIDRSLLTSNDSPEAQGLADASDSSSKSSEDFLMCKATALGINVRSRRRSSTIKPNDEIQDHLRKILELLRFGDYVQLIVRLQCELSVPHHHRYCCVISTTGKQDTEESVVLGIDITDRMATVGLVLPIWQDMFIKLYGDGGFQLITKDTEKQFKPVSVQALWASFQAVNRACHVARTNGYYSRGFTHDWINHYHNLPVSDSCQLQEWLKTDDMDDFNRYVAPVCTLASTATDEERERNRIESLLRVKLQELMCVVDLEEVTVLQLRMRLECELGMQLHDFRHFIDREVLSIYGRMDEASIIFDHLLLGTTFNASNRAELDRRAVSHILNVTREVDNFFPADRYEYKNIRVYDDEQSSLLPFFEDINRFINEAKLQGTSCLVHCKMGISRSATAVIAYVMKEQNMDLDAAFTFVKDRRPCIQPNSGFMRELQIYQGILEASSNRRKPIFCHESLDALAPLCRPPNQSSSPSSHILSGRPFSNFRLNESVNPDQPATAHSSTSSSEVPSNSSSELVDLEAELFTFKPRTLHGKATDHVVDCPQLTRPSCTMQPVPPSVVPFGPNVIWDVVDTAGSPDNIPEHSVTVLARNSHCLRQWHPDLIENAHVEPHLQLLNAAKSTHLLRFARARTFLPIVAECAEEINVFGLSPVTPVVCDSTDPVSCQSINSCLIRVCPEPEQFSVATIANSPFTYACLEQQWKMSVPSESDDQLLSDSSDLLSSDGSLIVQADVVSLKEADGCGLIPRLADVDASVEIPCSSSQYAVLHSARRVSYPSFFFRSSCTPVNTDSEMKFCLSDPLVSGTTQVDRKFEFAHRTALSGCPSVGKADVTSPGFNAEQNMYCKKHLDSGSDKKSVPKYHGVFRSARPVVSSHQVTSRHNIQISIAPSVKSRLRPDNSWIVFRTSTDPETTGNSSLCILNQSSGCLDHALPNVDNLPSKRLESIIDLFGAQPRTTMDNRQRVSAFSGRAASVCDLIMTQH